jgi:hypothetical protein
LRPEFRFVREHLGAVQYCLEEILYVAAGNGEVVFETKDEDTFYLSLFHLGIVREHGSSAGLEIVVGLHF